jgi:hypothetical protein
MPVSGPLQPDMICKQNYIMFVTVAISVDINVFVFMDILF